MSFTKTCGKCNEPIASHIVVRYRKGEHVLCPHVHKAAWMKKWSWKFPTTDAAEKAYRRVAFRASHPGQPGARRPIPKHPHRQSKRLDVCDYCRMHRNEHETRALYCPGEHNLRLPIDDRQRFHKRAEMDRYTVFNAKDIVIGHVKARSVMDAHKRALKTYGSRVKYVSVMSLRMKVGEHYSRTSQKKMRHRAPWRTSKGKKTECGYCGRKVRASSTFKDKKYGHLCPRCTVRVEKARATAKTMRDPTEKYYVTVRYTLNGKPHQFVFVVPAKSAHEARTLSRMKLPKGARWIGATATQVRNGRDPKKSKSRRWVDFIRKMKNNPRFRTASGKLDLKKLAKAFRAMKPHVRAAVTKKVNSLIKNTKHPDMNALSIEYSPIHQAYLVLWNGREILALRQSKEKAREFIRNLTAKVSNDPKTRNTTHKYPYGVYYRWAGKDYNDGYRFLGLKWKFLTSYTNISEAQAKVRKLKAEGLDAKWGRRDVIDRR